MAGLFRQGDVNFDNLFEAGNGPSAPSLRAGGVPLQYAPLSAGTKRPDVGYRIAGVDVSNSWPQKGSVQTKLPFDGVLYGTSNQAATGSTGTVSANTVFNTSTSGLFNISSQTGNPKTGSVLLGGGPASEYTYRIVTVSSSESYIVPGFSGSLTNGAETLAAITTGARNVAVSVSGPAASIADSNQITGNFRFELYRNGNLISQSTFSLTASAAGWQ